METEQDRDRDRQTYTWINRKTEVRMVVCKMHAGKYIGRMTIGQMGMSDKYFNLNEGQNARGRRAIPRKWSLLRGD